jgi:hypothetical protein
VNATEQLADRDHADCSVLLADRFFQRGRAGASLKLDQHVGVD